MKTAFLMAVFPAAVLTVFAPAALAQPVVNETYKVSGKTLMDVSASLKAQEAKIGGTAVTRFKWNYKYQIAGQGTQYKVQGVVVDTVITVVMPEWTGYSAAAPCMRQSWDRMVKSLRSHENQHVEKGRGVDGDVKAALLAVPTQTSIEAVKAVATKAANAVIARNNVIQKKFDADTDHGRKDPKDPIILRGCS